MIRSSSLTGETGTSISSALNPKKRTIPGSSAIDPIAPSVILESTQPSKYRIRLSLKTPLESDRLTTEPSELQIFEVQPPKDAKHESIRDSKITPLVRHHSAPHYTSSSHLPFSIAEQAASQLIGGSEKRLELRLKKGQESSGTIDSEHLFEMVQNSKKALEEHVEKEDKSLDSAYALFREMSEISPSLKISFTHQVAERQGKRLSMEDAFLFEEIEGGVLAGIFDGHGGALVSNFASHSFSRVFSEAREETEGNIYRAFEITIDRIHKAVAINPKMKFMGSTLAVSFIQENGRIYTATVGDSEVFVYDEDESGSLKSIPLSLVRDWGSPEEITRAVILARTPKEKEERKQWRKRSNPKMRRVRNGHLSLNLSRAIGDPGYLEVSKKPKITIAQLSPRSKIAFFCDGVTDFASQKEIIDLIKDSAPDCDLAAKVADYALDIKGSKDNVTAMFLYAHRK